MAIWVKAYWLKTVIARSSSPTQHMQAAPGPFIPPRGTPFLPTDMPASTRSDLTRPASREPRQIGPKEVV
jgi:hypothetical protein